jgi:hypothetical protein
MKPTYTLWQRIVIAIKLIFCGMPETKRYECSIGSYIKFPKGKWIKYEVQLAVDYVGETYIEKLIIDGKPKRKPQMYTLITK